MDRRQMIRGIGAAICAGMVPTFVPKLLPDDVPGFQWLTSPEDYQYQPHPGDDWMQTKAEITACVKQFEKNMYEACGLKSIDPKTGLYIPSNTSPSFVGPDEIYPETNRILSREAVKVGEFPIKLVNGEVLPADVSPVS